MDHFGDPAGVDILLRDDLVVFAVADHHVVDALAVGAQHFVAGPLLVAAGWSDHLDSEDLERLAGIDTVPIGVYQVSFLDVHCDAFRAVVVGNSHLLH